MTMTCLWIIAINTVVVLNMLMQHESLFKIHRHVHLDSRRVHHLFQSYFVLVLLFSLASIDLFHFKEVETPIPDLIASACTAFFTMAYIIKSYTSAALDSYDNLDRQLLLSTPDDHHPPVVSVVSTPNYTPMHQGLQTALSETLKPFDSKDISPLSSHSNNMFSHSQRTQMYTNMKTPIMATLLSSVDTVYGITTSGGGDPTLVQDVPHAQWKYALPTIISVLYLCSQLVYSLSMIKTNVFTRSHEVVVSSCLNMSLAVAILVLTQFSWSEQSSLVHFIHMPVLNYVLGTTLFVASAGVLVYQCIRHKARVSVQVYNSMGSP